MKLPRTLGLRIAFLCILAALATAPRCGGNPAPPAMVDDGTEVDDSSWFLNGFNSRNRMGRKDQQSHDLGLRFETPDLAQGQQVAYARLVLPATGDGTVDGALPLDIVGLDVDYVDFFSSLRPSENPLTGASSAWLIAKNWPGFTEAQNYSCVPLRRYSPDVSAIVNEILARPSWGSGPEKTLGIVVRDANGPGLSDNFVTSQDVAGFGGCSNQHAARLEIFETVRDTFVGKELLGRVTDSSATLNVRSLLPVDAFVEWGTSSGSYTGATAALSYAPEATIEQVLTGLLPDTRYYYRLRYRETGAPGFDAGPERWFHTQRPPGSTFSFAIQADSHLQNRLKENDVDGMSLYRQTMANIEADQPDFLVDLGDTFHTEFIQGRNAADLDESIQRHLDQRPFLNQTAPLYLVIGNHEGEFGWELDGTAENIPVWATTARKEIYPNPAPDGFYSGDLSSEPFVGQRESYYAFEWGDALILVLDPFWHTTTQPHDVGGPGSGDRWDWTLGQAQHAWLTQTLEQNSARFKLVFSHHVAGGITDYGRGGIKAAKHAIGGDGSYEWGGEDPDGSYVFDSKRPGWGKPVHDLMADNNVAIFFTGHDHVYVKEELDDVVYLEVPQPSNASYNKGFPENAQNYVGTRINNSGHLRVTVSDTRLDVEYVRAFNPGDGINGSVEVAFSVYDCNRNGVMDSEEGIVCECQDGIDNDADNDVDYPLDAGCSAPEDLSEEPDCADGLDNDGDGATDLADPGCVDAADGSEQNASVACDDGNDNDADGLIDTADPGCSSASDTDERGADVCDNGIDEDGDGLADAPADPGCAGPADIDERGSDVCDNGIDEDGDGLADAPADPGCAGPTDADERDGTGTWACDDGVDNDGDGLTDFPDDLGCGGPFDGGEQGSPALTCDNGIDDDGDGLADFPHDPGCADQLDPDERGSDVCDNGIDEDGDGLADAPADPGCAGPADTDERGSDVCDNGIDEDGDGLADAPADPGCDGPADIDERGSDVCDNGIDEDGDGLADAPADPGCAGPADLSEQNLSVACDDGIDNDSDGLIDTADPGCDDPADLSENSAVACNDGIDNDADNDVDFPQDAGCTDLEDPTEDFDCTDGLDNDGDGFTDYPDDPGCDSAADGNERGLALVCDNGVDDDGDGLADYPADPGCTLPSDPAEVDMLTVVDDFWKTIFYYDSPSGAFTGSQPLDPANAKPRGAALANGGLYSVDDQSHRVYRYAENGSFEVASGVLRRTSGAPLNSPKGLAVDGDDLWVVADSPGSARLHRFSVSAIFATVSNVNALQEVSLGGGNGAPNGLAMDDTYLYVLDREDYQLYRYLRSTGQLQGASRELRQFLGTAMIYPSGATILGDSMWVVELTFDKVFRYPMSALDFGSGGTVNASDEFGLAANNQDAQGI